MNDKDSRFSALARVMADKRRLLILTHDNPDPDAISSACALKYLLYHAFHVRARVVYSGIIGRAENRAMVKLLRLPIFSIDRLDIRRYDGVVLVDSQPETGYNPLPSGVHPVCVIDHHPLRKTTRAEFIDVREGVGATVTIVLDYFIKGGIDLPTNLATALFYGISSETQALSREATKEDIDAYITLFARTNKRLLSKILHPKLPKEYFYTLKYAIDEARVYKNLIWVSLGNVPTPDFVAQIADILLMHERISWVLCFGRYEGKIWISLRTSNVKANAGGVIKRLVRKRGVSGGHNMIAGGQIDLKSLHPDEIKGVEEDIVRRFLKTLHKDVDKALTGRPLLK